ncbi:MAG: hypothetical protein QNJ12_05235 [Ilumatobacter sp.]|uniref:hypothetical protein n=1 Tax=Ilumatobacter sp. TaxID=1967498 RepID=UPI00261BDDD0|nr:hypothetical protein [Ilumatobacter sp.]MDJ0768173.1 hypothetical protein [Ilumatobacter sp.]
MTDVLLVPCPHGITGVAAPKLQLSVFINIRLTPAVVTPLRQFADYRIWPNTLNAANLRVRFDGALVGAANVTTVSAPPSPTAWTALFGDPLPPTNDPQIDVRPWRAIDRRLLGLPHRVDQVELAKKLEEMYLQLGRNGAQLPSGADLAALGAAADFFGSAELGQAKTALQPDALGPDDPVLSNDDYDGSELTDFDFHRAQTYMSAHPELMRLLGLVVDLEIDMPPALPSVVSVDAPLLSDVREFNTHVDSTFRALPNPNPAPNTQAHPELVGVTLTEHKDRMQLDPGYLTAVDGMAAAIELLDVVADVQSGSPEEIGLPPIPEAGLSLLDEDKAVNLLARLERQWEVATTETELWSEDIVVGYRYDLRRDDSKDWLSPWQRDATSPGYEFPGSALVHEPGPDEGWQTEMLFTNTQRSFGPIGEEVGEFTNYWIDQNVFRWQGWSLVAGEPGRMLDKDGQPADRPAGSSAGTASPVSFAVDYFAVPLTLPRLRYGSQYEVRGRVVDLAGNSITVANGVSDAALISNLATYGRLSPIPVPVLVREELRPVPGWGDATAVIVLKSEWDQDDATVSPTTRMILPPAIAQARLELHGYPLSGDGIDPASYTELATRDSRSPTDLCTYDATNDELISITGPGDAPPAIPYLTDPAASGLAFEGLPGAAGTTIVPLDGGWPEHVGTRLKVRAGNEAPVVDLASLDDLTVWVPKGCDIATELSCAVRGDLVGDFYVHNNQPVPLQPGIAATMQSGRHWMTSSRTSVRLVHAVRQPLTIPVIADTVDTPSADRPFIGAVEAAFSGEVAFDDKVTGSIVVTGEWTDKIDDLTQPAPISVTTHRVIGTYDVPASSPLVFTDTQIDLHDTRRHDVFIDAEALSRFSRYFAEQVEITLVNAGQTVDSRGFTSTNFLVRNTATGELYQEGVQYSADPVNGTIARIPGGGAPPATPVTVEYIPLPISRFSTEGGVEKVHLVVPNSAPPAAVQVKRIMPSAERRRWDTQSATRLRHWGQTFRVYLDRPWCITGDGEQLAVVIQPAAAGEVTDMTRWGRDPLTTDLVVDPPSTADFTRATHVMTDVDGTGLDVAAHDVEYDPARKEWYCDITIEPPLGYRQWVTLALARFQRDSIDGAHLGPIHQSEPLRLGVTRQVRLRPRSGTLRVVASGRGVGNPMYARIEQADPAVADVDLGWAELLPDRLLDLRSMLGVDRWVAGIALPPTTTPLRLVLEEREPTEIDDDGTIVDGERVVYVETFEIPASWL